MSIMLASCGGKKGVLNHSSASNVADDLEDNIEEIAIVAIGDEVMVSDFYESTLGILNDTLPSLGLSVSTAAFATSGYPEQFEELNTKFNELRPIYVLELTPYLRFSSPTSTIYTTDVKLYYAPSRDVLWRSYIDIEIGGRKVPLNAPNLLAARIVDMLNQDGILNSAE